MISFLKLIRYKNLLMVLLTIILTKYALLDHFFLSHTDRNIQISILILSVLFITAGGYIVNDIYDIKTDIINKPKKKVLKDKVFAWKLYYLFTLIGVVLGLYLSFFESDKYNSFYFILVPLLLFLYSKYLKNKILIGNVIVSYFTSLVIYLTYIYSIEILHYSSDIDKFHLERINHIDVVFNIVIYCFFAFITTLIREIIKDIEDIDGDYAIKAKTLPIVIGRKRANRIALGFSILLLLFLVVIIREFLFDYPLFLGYSIVFLLVPIIYFIYQLYSAESKKDYSFLSKLMKIIMFFGILSMLFFKFR